MKKFFMFLCIVIMFFGIVDSPSYDDPAPKATTSSVVTKSQNGGDDASPVSASATLVLLGSGLLGLAEFGRKIFKKYVSSNHS